MCTPWFVFGSPSFPYISINDLPHDVRNSAISMYAHDTSLWYQASDIHTLNEAINTDPIELGTWLKGNKLSLNVAKQVLCVCLQSKNTAFKSHNEELHLKIRNKELEVIQKSKLLFCGDQQFS